MVTALLALLGDQRMGHDAPTASAGWCCRAVARRILIALFRFRSCLRRCSFLRARSGENAGHRDVPFMTRILVHLSVRTLQTDHEGPRACPCGGIVNRQFPIDVV